MGIIIAPSRGREKTYEVLDRDFVPEDARCVTCHRSFSSGAALVVLDAYGQRQPIGPTCAAKHAFKRDPVLHDFTQAARRDVKDVHDDWEAEKKIEVHPEGFANPSTAFNRPKSALTKRQHHILQVAQLRIHKLPAVGIDIPTPNAMQALMSRWDRGEDVPPDLWNKVDSIIQNAEASALENSGRATLAYSALMTTYAVAHWINRIQKRPLSPEAKKELSALQNTQRKYRHLFPKEYNQLAQISRRSGVKVLELDTAWLRRATTPKQQTLLPTP